LQKLLATKNALTAEIIPNRFLRLNSQNELPELPSRFRPLLGKLMQQPISGQKFGYCIFASHRSVAGPFKVSRIADQTGSNRIQQDIAAQLQQIRVLVNEYGFEAPLKEMPGGSVYLVEVLRVDSIQLTHTCR
jgi:hypothetical protein